MSSILIIRLLPEYKDSKIVRSRDKAVLDEADIVVDVGAEYDPSRHRYDHHQREFNEFFSAERKITKLSSAGLIYKHFGKRIICSVLGWPEEHEHLEEVYQKVYTDTVEGFDGNDNGVDRHPGSKPLYRDGTSIASRVARLNPAWNEQNVDLDGQFMKAVEITGEEILYTIKFVANQWLPARDLVKNLLDSR